MLDDLFKAMADPTRRSILRILRKRDLNVSQLRQRVRVTGPTLSHHLDILKRADLVVTERRGKFIVYSVNTSVFDDIVQNLYSYFSS